MTASWFESPTLTGDRVRLEPLGVAHTDALLAAADDPAIFRWTASPITDREQAQSTSLQQPTTLIGSPLRR